MSAKFLLLLVCVAVLSKLVFSGSHKKVVIHVPVYVKHHHHKHTIVKHVHHKPKSEDHYEVLGYTYGMPKISKGSRWHAAGADEDFEGSEHSGYALGGEEEYIIRGY